MIHWIKNDDLHKDTLAIFALPKYLLPEVLEGMIEGRDVSLVAFYCMNLFLSQRNINFSF